MLFRELGYGPYVVPTGEVSDAFTGTSTCSGTVQQTRRGSPIDIERGHGTGKRKIRAGGWVDHPAGIVSANAIDRTRDGRPKFAVLARFALFRSSGRSKQIGAVERSKEVSNDKC